MQAHYQGVIHLSAGDLLRAEVDGGTAVGTPCAIRMKEGKRVPLSVRGGGLGSHSGGFGWRRGDLRRDWHSDMAVSSRYVETRERIDIG